jgi:hypothetical protein
MDESELYELVRDFAKKRYKCFFATIEAGKQRVGSVDVFEVRHKNPEQSEIETIGVEVKKNIVSPCNDFGQTKGYSVFCHRTYLASMDEFNKDDIEIAKYLKIGLIQITRENSNFVCRVALEAHTSDPIKRLLDYVLGSKRIYQCETCKVFDWHKRNFTVVRSWDNVSEWTKKQIRNGKGLRIRQKDGKREFYCNRHAKIKLGIC